MPAAAAPAASDAFVSNLSSVACFAVLKRYSVHHLSALKVRVPSLPVVSESSKGIVSLPKAGLLVVPPKASKSSDWIC